jgi:hypothetical protein
MIGRIIGNHASVHFGVGGGGGRLEGFVEREIVEFDQLVRRRLVGF